MTPLRFALGLLAVVSGLGALYLATTDIHYTDRNCGTAVFATDVSALSFDTGDLEADEFTEESLISNCNQLVLQRRFFTALPAAVCVGSIIAGRTLRDRKPRMRGSIFGGAH